MNTKLLRKLCEIPGVPGREERVRAFIKREVGDLFDSVDADASGALDLEEVKVALKKWQQDRDVFY